MYRNIDVMTEMRKLTDSKPVHAVAGAGVLASQTLRDLPGLVARWGKENPVTALQSRATGYVHTARTTATEYVQTARSNATEAVQTARSNATGAVHTARTRAADGYDTLAARGKKALNGQSHRAQAKTTPAVQGKTAAHGTTATEGTSAAHGTTGAQGKTANGKPKGKASSRTSTSH